jgi:hypothetical protein
MSKIVKYTTPEQLAFDVFDTLRREDGATVDITRSPREIGYRKGTVLLTVTALGLLQRRVVNAAWYFASQNPSQESFDIDLAHFRWMARYDSSNNYAHLRKVLNECQKATVQVEDVTKEDSKWVSVQLLGRVAIAGGRISFKVDELIRKQLENPKSFTFLSVRIGAALSVYSYALYEQLGALAYQGTTDWFTVEEVRAWVNADAAPSLAEYKQFKRYVIDKAITQINELTDIFATYEVRTGKGTRRVTHIRFKIRNNPTGALVLDMTRPHELKELHDTLINDFALSQDEIQELVDNRDTYTDERILAAIDFTRTRAKTGKVKQPGRYLMTAIRDHLRIGNVEKEMSNVRPLAIVDNTPSPKAKIDQQNLNEKVFIESEKGIVLFESLDDEDRAQLILELTKEVTFKSALRRQKVKIAEAKNEEVLLQDSMLRMELGVYAFRRLKPTIKRTAARK